MPHFSRVFLPRLSRLAFTLVRPAVFVPLMLSTVALGYALPSTDTALARCENRGGSVTECRLIVLGRLRLFHCVKHWRCPFASGPAWLYC